MKRLIAAVLAVMFIAGTGSGIANAKLQETDRVEVKSSVDVKIGTSADAVFTLDTKSIKAEKIELKDASGKTVSKMNDNGKKGDAEKNDGIYSAKLTLSSDTRSLVKYTAYADGKAVRTYEVNYYKDFTAQDEANVQAVYDGINALETALEAEGKDDDEIFTSVVKYIESCDCIESVSVENDSCTYISDAGIGSLYARFGDDVKGAGEPTDNAVAITANGENIDLKAVGVPEGNAGLQSWTNPNVLLVRPYRNVEGQEGFHNDRYIDAAKLITKYTKGYITVLDNEDTIPYNLLHNFWKNGFVMVDSHGLTGGTNSYMSVWDGAGYDSADVSAGRIMKNSDATHVYVSGEYFRHHYEQMNRKMENTFLYFGICYGMTYDTLRTPFFEMGAVCAYGYDNSVSMGYEGYNLLTMYPYLTTICAEDETRTYNLEEAIAEAIRKNGSVDPYGTFGAHIEAHGDTKFVVYKPDVAVTGVTMEDKTVEGIVGTNAYCPIKLTPEKMVYGYTQEWSSSDTDVAEVVGTRTLYCKKNGETTVTVKVTYEGKTYTDTCKLVVTDILPESITAAYSGANADIKVGQTREIYAEIFPAYCGNKTICYSSNNPGVISVDAKGKLISHRPGKAVVTVYSEALPSVCARLNIEVVDDVVYKSGCAMDYDHNFMIVSNDSNSAAICAIENPTYTDYMQSRNLAKLLGYYSGNISGICMWQFKEAKGGFYLYNESTGTYLAMSDKEGVLCMTEVPVSIFAFADNNRIYTVNPVIETDNVYLRLNSNRGFYLSSSGTKLDIVKAIDFKSDEYVTVSFNDDGKTIATQKLEKGEKAVAAVPDKKEGKTFLGWEKSLYGITENMTVNAVYENGDSDKYIITFKDMDGTTLSRVELAQGETCTPPTAPEHEGYRFAGWSEDIEHISSSMIVFAVYKLGVIGDVNDDGTVNTADAVLILKNSAGLVTLDKQQLSVSDVTGDGDVNTADAVMILKYASGLINEF